MKNQIVKTAYLETTMFNYYFDTDRDAHEATVMLFTAIAKGEYEAYTSQYVVDELQNAPEPKRTDMLTLLGKSNIPIIPKSEDAEELADRYLKENKGIPSKKILDAQHIAIASSRGLDYIFSCNFHHINKESTKEMVNRVNAEAGYKPIKIINPQEVFNDEEEPD
jgi:predicted nucleic acid-binding protein